MIYRKQILLILLALLGLWPLTAHAQTPPYVVLSPDITVREDAALIQVPLTLSEAVTGLSGYIIDVDVTSGSIQAATVDTAFSLGTTVASGTAIQIKAVDLATAINPGDTDIPLAVVDIMPQLGVIVLSLAVTMDDDVGDFLSPTTQIGAITVLPYPTLPGQNGKVADLDKDGLAEDINGNGRLDFHDLVMLFTHMLSAEVQGDADLFDWNANGRVDFDDVVQMFNVGIVGVGP